MAKKANGSRVIEMTNVGAVGHVIDGPPGGFLSLDVSQPGLYLLTSANGSGKSTFLSGVQTLVSGEGKIPVADGCSEAEICGLGLRMVAGRNQKRYGQLEVNSLDDSGMSLATVVDPGLKDPVAADSKRIKSLIQISGIEASTALFTHLFSGEQEFKDIVQIGSMESKDLVDMASKIKRDVDTAALQLEKDVISNTAKAQGSRQSVPEVVEDTGESLADLEASLKVAQANCGVIRSNKAQAEAIKARHDESAKLMAGASTIDVDAIVAEGKLISADIAEKAAKIEELQSKIEELQKELAVQKSQKESADKSKLDCLSRWNAAKQHNEKIAAIQESMAQSLPDIPTDEEVAAYDSVVLDVTRRIESVKNADRILATLQQVAELVSKIEEDDLQGRRLRKIASQVESVLSNAVSETGNMRVNAKGRLVMDTDRGEELFSDLSVGERYRAVIQTAIAAMARRFPGQIPIATLPQEAYESLQPSVREELKVMCHEQGIVLITAVAADNPEIDIEVF